MQLRKIELNNFCGFKNFSTEISDSTVFVGPNNCGKTTLLKAIQFGIDALHLSLGDQQLPNLNRISGSGIRCSLHEITNRQGILDFNLIYYQKNRQNGANVNLTFVDGNNTTQVKTSCLPSDNNLSLEIYHKGIRIQDFNSESEKRDILNPIYAIKSQGPLNYLPFCVD